jgi:putative SOS response-associated peptidase YedK
MCGRFTLRTPAAILKDYFGLPALPGFPPRYNIAPTQPVGAVRMAAAGREWVDLRWGLVPFWAEDPSVGSRMINARAETVGSKPAFRESFEQRRCLVAADGFYEWQRREDGSKQPYYMTIRDESPIAFAGLWDRWRQKGSGVVIESCTIITTRPNALLAPIHDRMPVILDADGATEWLRPEAVAGALDVLLQPFPAERMRATPVSHRVNRPANDDPECIVAVAPAPIDQRLF